VVKPDPRIFRICLERNRLEPGACVFIDDAPANVAGAAAVGIDAIRFEDAGRLAAALRTRGLLD
jgi:2-haloacid dehalogenase